MRCPNFGVSFTTRVVGANPQLFSINVFTGRLLFKGGTSLAKIFHAINRFSEDIDLAVDYVALGFKGERDPRREGISKTNRAGILDEMMTECHRYIGGEFLDVLKARRGEILGATDAWSLNISQQDPNVVQFRYPTAITKNFDYVFPQVVLELGTHAEFVPRDRFRIRSFAAEEFPKVVTDGDVPVIALLAKRTFWRKQQFFMRNTTARRKNQSLTAIRVITMTLPCWLKDRFGRTL